MLMDNRELFGQIITHQLPRERIAEGFKLVLAGETGKVVDRG